MTQKKPVANRPVQEHPEKQVPPQEQTVNKGGSIASKPLFNEALLKKIFYGSLLFMLIATWIGGFNVGYHQDEIDMNLYGKANISYYTSGGKDTSYLGTKIGFKTFDTLLRYYGCGFEYFAQGANVIAGTKDGKQEFNVRHMVCQLIGIIGFLYLGLIARKLLDWRAAIIAIWLAFLSPSFYGQMFFNTKDIPFCAGYAVSLYYIICFLQELPVVSWKTSIKLMLALVYTIDIRIGGILLVAYLFLFSAVYVFTKPELLKSVLKNFTAVALRYATVVFGGFILLILLWPYLMRSPVKNFMRTMDVVKNYPMKMNINFGGQTIDSLTIPPSYIPTLLSITIPIFVLVFFFVVSFFAFFKRKKIDIKISLLLLFAALFPVIYAALTKATIYTGWRHFLFIYPMICIFATVGIICVSEYLNKMAYKAVFAGACCLSLVHPIVWAVRNHPYQYCYFNELSGGFKNIYSSYDTDYWQITMKDAMDWMMHDYMQSPLFKTKDTLFVGTNIPQILEYYLYAQYPVESKKIKVAPAGCTSRNLVNWKYAVFNTFLLKPSYLENWFPPKTMVYSVNIDGMPATVVLRDTARLDIKAFEALKFANHKLSDSLYTAHIAATKDDNPAIDAYISVAKASLNENDLAIQNANRALQYHFSNVLDYNAQCGLGIAYANKHQFDLSVNALKTAERLMPQERYSKDILAQVYRVMQMERAGGQMPQPTGGKPQ